MTVNYRHKFWNFDFEILVDPEGPSSTGTAMDRNCEGWELRSMKTVKDENN